MSEHTPGPWYVQDDSERHPGVRNRGGFICFTPHVSRYPDQEERYAKEIGERAANARLIAAAPDLLEALKDACLDIAQYGGQPPAKWLEAIANAEEKD